MAGTNQTVDLKYSISGKTLTGQVLGESIRATAVSGGGANATGSDPDLSNNPDLTMVKRPDGKPNPSKPTYTKYEFSPAVITPTGASPGRLISKRVSYRGGPPPTGLYVLQITGGTPHGRITMVPQFPTNRTGLQIHSSGPLGSDGCIVLVSNHDLSRVRTAVQQVPVGKARLEVVR